MSIFYRSPQRSTSPKPKILQEFSYRGLNSVHAIEYPHIPSPDLKNNIHPMFYRKNFKAGGAVYSILKPALQLASLFITEDCCLEWWHNTQYGERRRVTDVPEVCNIPGFPNLDGQVIIPPLWHCPQQRADLIQGFLNLADHITITWGTRPGGHDYGLNIKSRTDPFPDAQEILLHPNFLEFIQKGRFFAANAAQQVRFLFHFAVNLTHELAHAVFDCRGDTFRTDPEPYYLPDIQAGYYLTEMGSSWERSIFGCKIQPISGYESCANGLMSFQACHPKALNPGEVLVFNAVPMVYVREILTEDKWCDVRWCGVRSLRCPETDVKSLSAQISDEYDGIARKQIPKSPPAPRLMSAY